MIVAFKRKRTALVVRCPSCGKTYQCDDAHAGRVFPCGCGKRLRIPSGALTETSASRIPHVTIDAERPPVVINVRPKWWWVNWVAVSAAACALIGFLLYFRSAVPKNETTATPQTGAPSRFPTSCAQKRIPDHLKTGAKVRPDRKADGDSTLTVDNGTDSEAVIRVVEGIPLKTVRFVYIQPHSKYTIIRMEPGLYHLRYGLGTGWVGECLDFQQDYAFGEFDHLFFFQYGGVTTDSVTLQTMPFGNASTTPISRADFLGDESTNIAK